MGLQSLLFSVTTIARLPKSNCRDDCKRLSLLFYLDDTLLSKPEMDFIYWRFFYPSLIPGIVA